MSKKIDVQIIIGSKSDETKVKPAIDTLGEFGIAYDFKVASAHRSPSYVEEIIDNAINMGVKVFITGAGMANHLSGTVASRTTLPVIGIPFSGGISDGMDSLLATVQMPPGVPVLAVGVNRGDVAAENCIKMLKKYENVTLIGDKNNNAVEKSVDILKKFKVAHVFDDKPNPNSVNIEFTYFDEPIEKKDELVIYCPLLLEKDDKAEAALNLLKHTNHGLWVGANNGVNAAVAAIEIMNIDNEYKEMLASYRKEIGEKVLEANK